MLAGTAKAEEDTGLESSGSYYYQRYDGNSGGGAPNTDGGSMHKLYRTITTEGNRRKFTFSGWIKKDRLMTINSTWQTATIIGSGTAGPESWGSTSNFFYFAWANFQSGQDRDQLCIYDGPGGGQVMVTNAYFRDTTCWYHIVLQYDSENSTQADRTIVHVNGVRQTLSKNTCAQNADSALTRVSVVSGHTNDIQIGTGSYQSSAYGGSNQYSECYLLDGTLKAPSEFAQENSTTKQWVPKVTEFSLSEYGTNGFYLPFKEGSRYSAYFNGTNAALSTADHSDFEFGTNSFTIECWAIADYSDTNTRYLFGQAAANGADSTASFQVQMTGSTKKLSAYVFNGGYQGVGGTIAITPGEWFHVALVRNGNTLSLYVDGVLSGSNVTWSETVNNSSSSVSVGRYGDCTANWHYGWKGFISDFRIVNGTAVYTSAFTPPTTPLTAITNTKMLCCNHATVTTESSGTSKTLSITTADSVWSEKLSPFNFDWYQDHSGKNNHFKFETWSGAALYNIGSRYVREDSPVNNYCVMNTNADGITASQAGITQGGLKVLSDNNNSGLWGTMSVTSGKWYYEVFINHWISGGGHFFGWNVPYGYISNASDANTRWHKDHGGEPTFVGVSTYNGDNHLGTGTNASYGSAYTTGDILMCAFDVDNKKMWFGKNGTWFDSGNPATGANNLLSGGTWILPEYHHGGIPTYVPCMGRGGSYDETYTFNFGQNGTFCGSKTAQNNNDGNYGNFYYAVPSGFKALVSSNLPEPASHSKANFDVVTYTGNGGTNAISGLGFQPNIVFVKARSNSHDGMWVDSLRGATKHLDTDGNAVQATVSTGLTSFDATGFTLGADSNLNTSGHTYVAFCWGISTSVTNYSEDGGASSAPWLLASNALVNTTIGMTYAKHEGDGNAGTLTRHGQAGTPGWYLSRQVDNSENWLLYHYSNIVKSAAGAATSYGQYAYLNSQTMAGGSNQTGGHPTATALPNWARDDTVISWVIRNTDGFCKIGIYGGTETASCYVHLGFKPAFIMIKRPSYDSDFIIFNNQTDTENPITNNVDWNNSNAEGTDYTVDFYAAGFNIRAHHEDINNENWHNYYIAFAAQPFKYANAG